VFRRKSVRCPIPEICLAFSGGMSHRRPSALSRRAISIDWGHVFTIRLCCRLEVTRPRKKRPEATERFSLEFWVWGRLFEWTLAPTTPRSTGESE